MKGSKGGPNPLSKARLFGLSSVIALIIAVPAISVTLLTHYYIRTDLLVTISLGLLTLFIGMGVGYRISKKFVTTN